MSLLHIPINMIDETRLQSLIIAGASESVTIEYKQSTYGNSDGDYAEFLADLTSFANTSGGDIVIGMIATKGIPCSFLPLSVPIDSEVLRLEQIARGGLAPRVANLTFHVVPVQNGNVLIIRVPRSFTQPHRIIRRGSNRFWARGAAGKYEPDVNELRRLYLSGSQLSDRIRDFRATRISLVSAGQSPVLLLERGTLIIHLIPLSAFDMPTEIGLSEMERNYRIFSPIESTIASGARITYDGVLKTSNADPQATQHRAYTLLYRNGIVESVTSTLINETSGTISSIDDKIVREVLLKLSQLSSIGVGPPYAVSVSLTGVRGARFNFARPRGNQFGDLGNPLDHDQFHPPEVMFDAVPVDMSGCAMVIRPILDQLANAGGVAVSPVFNQEGLYIPV